MLADTCAEGTLTAACLSGDIILDSRAVGDRTKECDLTVLHGTRHSDWTHNSEYSSRPA